jgi:hypothetical protein
MDKEEAYLQTLNLIAGLNMGESTSGVINSLETIDEDLSLKHAILTEMSKSMIFPDAFMKIITLMKFIQSEKNEINGYYEESMEKYEEINQLTSKGRPSDDEAKIKKTLTDFILKIESIYEIQLKADEGILKELNRHMNELNLKPGSISKEHLNHKISTRYAQSIQPFIVSLLDAYSQYNKNKNIVKRLVKIAGYIIEDAQKKN